VSRIFTTSFASVYPHYVAKVEKKGRTKAELDEVIEWLTGYDESALAEHLTAGTTFEDFFAQARLNPNASAIKGLVCGVRVEEIEDPLMQKIRYLDKLVGERWDRPGLGDWDVRALVGHTSRALLTVESYLARPAAAVEIETAAEYFRAARPVAAGDEVTQRGRDAGAALADYLPTRTFELAVHTADLAVALGEAPDVPGPAAAQALGIV